MPGAGSATLLGAAEVRRLAEELDLRPSKQRGQNFVIDGNTVRRIVRDAGVSEDDVVIEIVSETVEESRKAKAKAAKA